MFRVLEHKGVSGVEYVSAVNPTLADGVVPSMYGAGRNDYANAGR